MQEAIYTSGAVTTDPSGGFGLLANLKAKLEAKEAEQARVVEMERLLDSEGLPSELPEEPAFSDEAFSIDTVSMDATPGIIRTLGNRGRGWGAPGGTVSGAHLADASDAEDGPLASGPGSEGRERTPEPVPGRELRVDLLEALADLRERGHAAPVGRTLDDLSPEVLECAYGLAEAGLAHLWAEAGGIVLATANSTAGDRRRAVEALPPKPGPANHVTELVHLPGGGGMIGCWPNLLLSLGELHFSGGEDSVREEGFRVLPEATRLRLEGEERLPDEELRGMPAPERAAHAKARAGYLRRTTVVCEILPYDHNARAETLAADEAFRASRFRRSSAACGFDAGGLRVRLAEAHLKAAASDRARADADYERYHTEAAKPAAVAKEARRLMALSDSFFKKAELERLRDNALRMRGEVLARRRAGSELVVRPLAECAPELVGPGAERAARRAANALSCRWVSPAEAEAAAWRTAAAIALSRLGERYPALHAGGEGQPVEEAHLRLARKALHLIRREGGAAKVSRLYGLAKAEHGRPEVAGVSERQLLRSALEALRTSGAVRPYRDENGELAAEATKKLDRRSYGRELLRVIADPENGIPVPSGSRLERRLKAYVEEVERQLALRPAAEPLPAATPGTLAA